MQIVDALEALLFVAQGPVPLEQLAVSLGVAQGQVEQALDILRQRYEERGALLVLEIAGGWQICTKPEHAERIADFLKPQRHRLGRSLLEVLAVVAYKQPITTAEIEAVRGVQSDYSIRNLVERRLIHEVGRKKAPGRPVQFGTTQQFLHQFKLRSLDDLPELQTGESEFALVMDDE